MTEPKFTDEDLKRFKAYLIAKSETCSHDNTGWDCMAPVNVCAITKDAKALIARLECAEDVCEASRIHGGPCSDDNALANQCNLCTALEFWLCSKGDR